MTDEHTDSIRGILAAIAIGIIIWLFVGWAVYGVWCWFHPCQPCEPRGGVVEPWIKARMQYHGISVCYEDWNGNHYFIRDGRRCPL